MYSFDDMRKLTRVYYNIFKGIREEENIKRGDIMDGKMNKEILNDLKNGNTIHLVFNKWFIDMYYKKIPFIDKYTCVTIMYEL